MNNNQDVNNVHGFRYWSCIRLCPHVFWRLESLGYNLSDAASQLSYAPGLPRCKRNQRVGSVSNYSSITPPETNPNAEYAVVVLLCTSPLEPVIALRKFAHPLRSPTFRPTLATSSAASVSASVWLLQVHVRGRSLSKAPLASLQDYTSASEAFWVELLSSNLRHFCATHLPSPQTAAARNFQQRTPPPPQTSQNHRQRTLFLQSWVSKIILCSWVMKSCALL